MKKMVTGMAAVMAVLSLAGCGGQAQSGQHSSATKSSKVAKESSSMAAASASSAQAKSSSQATQVDDKTAGVLVALLANPDWFKGAIQDNEMYYGDDIAKYGSGSSKGSLAGYSFLTANGDPTSYLYYKVNGDQVTYKQWIPGESVAEGHMRTRTISLARLEKDYYVTQDQKNEVDGYASQLQPEEAYMSSIKNAESSSDDQN